MNRKVCRKTLVMIKFKLFILLCFCASIVWGQGSPEQKTPVRDSLAKFEAFSSDRNSLKNKQPLAELQEVLFATNEDCDLFVDEQLKGVVTKSKYLYIKLAPGNHTYRAKSKSAASELKESFKVESDVVNEVFIDLLYAIDESQKTQTIPNTVVSGTAPANDNEAGEPTEQQRLATAREILSNMISIKGGDFKMGNNNAPSGDELEHAVTIRSFLFGKYEVTQQQWQDVMGSNPSENKGCANCPVENVSWEDVMKFIRRINVASNKRFRLPTEAEWEYVARIGGKPEIDSAGGQEEYIKKTAWYFANSDKKTHPVGEKQPNILGIYDLYGNVSEWCSDWYAPYYYKDDDSQKSPEGPPLGKEKVVRGGSFSEYLGDRFRPSLRNKLKPTTKLREVGFRLVMDVY